MAMTSSHAATSAHHNEYARVSIDGGQWSSTCRPKKEKESLVCFFKFKNHKFHHIICLNIN